MEIKSLYEIEKDYLSIIQILEETEGELSPELEESLKLTHENLEKKALAYVEYINDREFYLEKVKAELERLTLMKKRQEKTIEKLEENLKDAVKIFGGQIKAGMYTIKTSPSYSLEITDESKIPAEYYTEEKKTIKKFDTNAIKKAIKDNNIIIDGAVVHTRQNLKIK